MELIGVGVLLIGALGLVVYFTHRVFSRDLSRALRRVTQQEQELQEKADILEQRLAQMELEYQAKLKRGETEAERLVQDAKNQAVNIRTAAIEEAKHRARQLLLEVEHGKTLLQSEMTRELNGKVVRQACESLRALLPPHAFAALHGTLVHELIDALAHLQPATFGPGAQRVEVMTAQPLSSADSQQIAQWVVSAMGKDVPVTLTTNPSLVAGGVVRIGDTVVDNSLANRLSPRA